MPKLRKPPLFINFSPKIKPITHSHFPLIETRCVVQAFPSEDARDDIYHGTGQKCDHMLPILLHLELIGKRLENNQIIQTINKSKWESFCSLFPEDMSLQFDEYINPAHRKREFYLCGGQPRYSGPRSQIKALYEK